MKKKSISKANVKWVEVSSLIPPEYREKQQIEGRETHLNTALRKHGLKQTIVVNGYPGRENVVVNGVSVVELCKQAGFTKILAVVINVPLEDEKEIHFNLNYQPTAISCETIKRLLNKGYSEYFPSYEDISTHMLQNKSLKAEDVYHIKPITAHLNAEEKKMFVEAKKHLKCDKDSQVVKALINYYITKEVIKWN